jgi:hypothetical protein
MDRAMKAMLPRHPDIVAVCSTNQGYQIGLYIIPFFAFIILLNINRNYTNNGIA